MDDFNGVLNVKKTHYPSCFLTKMCVCVQVRKAGETVMVAGMAAMVGLGIVALAGALFGGSKKEREDRQ